MSFFYFLYFVTSIGIMQQDKKKRNWWFTLHLKFSQILLNCLVRRCFDTIFISQTQNKLGNIWVVLKFIYFMPYLMT